MAAPSNGLLPVPAPGALAVGTGHRLGVWHWALALQKLDGTLERESLPVWCRPLAAIRSPHMAPSRLLVLQDHMAAGPVCSRGWAHRPAAKVEGSSLRAEGLGRESRQSLDPGKC